MGIREMIFRGKRTDNGEWVYGDLTHSVYKIGDTCVGKYGCEIGMHQVDPSTVGQYTGLTDKNGTRIFEGDVVVIETDCIPSFMLNRYVVVWDDDQTAYKLLKDNTIYDIPMGRMEIIGNIHDNPELLEEVFDGNQKD